MSQDRHSFTVRVGHINSSQNISMIDVSVPVLNFCFCYFVLSHILGLRLPSSLPPSDYPQHGKNLPWIPNTVLPPLIFRELRGEQKVIERLRRETGLGWCVELDRPLYRPTSSFFSYITTGRVICTYLTCFSII